MKIQVNGKEFVLDELFFVDRAPDNQCTLVFDESPGDYIVLGAPLFRSMCVSFDNEARQIGFHKINKK